MSGLQQLCLSDPILLISVWCSSLPPFVIAGSVYSHEPAQKIHRILCSQFFDDFVVFPLPVTYSLLAPTPSTQYPFFNRAISISCLAMMSRSRSNSSNDLLCSAAYGLPFQIPLHPGGHQAVPHAALPLDLLDGEVLIQVQANDLQFFLFTSLPVWCSLFFS